MDSVSHMIVDGDMRSVALLLNQLTLQEQYVADDAANAVMIARCAWRCYCSCLTPVKRVEDIHSLLGAPVHSKLAGVQRALFSDSCVLEPRPEDVRISAMRLWKCCSFA